MHQEKITRLNSGVLKSAKYTKKLKGCVRLIKEADHIHNKFSEGKKKFLKINQKKYLFFLPEEKNKTDGKK